MIYGNMVGGSVLLCAEGQGLPVVAVDAPEAPAGFHAEQSWAQAGGRIVQAWSIVPDEGTPQQAAVELARMQAASLPDEQAALVSALFPAWGGAGVAYAAGDRVLWQGRLYRCVTAHASQPDWAPGEAPSLWARVLPGQSGEVGEWEQPDSTEGYAKGDRVTHGGRTWESLVDANVHEPGTDNGAAWRDVTEGA